MNMRIIQLLIMGLLIISINLSCASDNDILATYTLNKKQYVVKRKEVKTFMKALLKKFPKKQKSLKYFISQYIYMNTMDQLAKDDKFYSKKLFAELKDSLDVGLYIRYFSYFSQIQFMKPETKFPFYKLSVLQFRYPDKSKFKNKNLFKKKCKEVDSQAFKLYTLIKSGKTKYDDVIKSTHKNRKTNYNKIDFKSKLELKDAHLWAVHRIMKRKGVEQFRTVERVKIYSKPSTSSRNIFRMQKNELFVKAKGEINVPDKWAYIEYAPDYYGYVLKKSLKSIGKNNSMVSFPIKHFRGYDLIKIISHKKLNRRQFTRETMAYYKKKSSKLYMNIINRRWKTIVKKHMKEHLTSILNKRIKNVTVRLPKNWRNKKILFKFDDITISKDEFQKYLRLNMIIYAKKIKGAYLNKTFFGYVKVKVLNDHLKKVGFVNNEEYKPLFEIRRKILRTEMYKNVVWAKKVTVKEDEVKKLYEMKKTKYAHTHKNDIVKKPYPPYVKVRQAFYDRLITKKKKKYMRINRTILLDKLQIKYSL